MDVSRRSALLSVAISVVQLPEPEPSPHAPHFPEPDEDDEKLPNGKSRRDAMAAAQHKQALKDAGELVELATEVRTELERAGNFVVPLATLKKTEEIEKVARRIRNRLKS